MTLARPNRTDPYPRSEQKNPMTSIHVYDPSDGAALPELPPLPIGVLTVGTADLLQQAADLPQPRCIFIYGNGQAISLQFAPEQASVRAITRWALRFGSVVTSEPHQDTGRPGTWHRDRVRLLRHRRQSVCPRPGRTGQQLADQEKSHAQPAARTACHPPSRMSTRQGSRAIDGVVLM